MWVRVCPYHERLIAHENLMLTHIAKRKAIPLSDSPPKKRREKKR